MIYIIELIGIVVILIFILWIRKSRGASSYYEGSKVWQNELDRRWIDDYDPYN